jgi:hypothetical protein
MTSAIIMPPSGPSLEVKKSIYFKMYHGENNPEPKIQKFFIILSFIGTGSYSELHV